MRTSRARSLAERLIKEDTHVHVHVHAAPEGTGQAVVSPAPVAVKPAGPKGASGPVGVEGVKVDATTDAQDLDDLKELAPKLDLTPMTPAGNVPAAPPRPEVLSPGACSYVLRVKRDELGRISEVIATRL